LATLCFLGDTSTTAARVEAVKDLFALYHAYTVLRESKEIYKKNETQLGIGPRILVRCSYHQATVHVQHVYAGPVSQLGWKFECCG
jgi:hypothetical protein